MQYYINWVLFKIRKLFLWKVKNCQGAIQPVLRGKSGMTKKTENKK